MAGYMFGAADGTWAKLGYVSDDGITLSSGNASVEITPEHLSLKDGQTDTVVFEVSGKDKWPMPMDAITELRMSFRHSTRKGMLRERAEEIGGKFLRSYLRSQRRSRMNTGKKYATGGIVRRTEAVMCGVRVEPLVGGAGFVFSSGMR